MVKMIIEYCAKWLEEPGENERDLMMCTGCITTQNYG